MTRPCRVCSDGSRRARHGPADSGRDYLDLFLNGRRLEEGPAQVIAHLPAHTCERSSAGLVGGLLHACSLNNRALFQPERPAIEDGSGRQRRAVPHRGRLLSTARQAALPMRAEHTQGRLWVVRGDNIHPTPARRP